MVVRGSEEGRGEGGSRLLACLLASRRGDGKWRGEWGVWMGLGYFGEGGDSGEWVADWICFPFPFSFS